MNQLWLIWSDLLNEIESQIHVVVLEAHCKKSSACFGVETVDVNWKFVDQEWNEIEPTTNTIERKTTNLLSDTLF